jgi:segregation and condensation protein A
VVSYKLEKFEGPLSLLLKLIEQEEMDITTVSLAKVADQFVSYIRAATTIDPEEMADFLVVAARLLYIKSKALLPYLFPEEEPAVAELEEQLRMYREFLEAAKGIEKLIGKKKFMFAREFNRQAILQSTKLFSPPAKLNADIMRGVFEELLGRLQPPEEMGEATIVSRVTIDDKIGAIRAILLERIEVSFQRFLSEAKDKTEVIVSFLAVLELMRQREVVLEQAEMFGDIVISRPTMVEELVIVEE